MTPDEIVPIKRLPERRRNAHWTILDIEQELAEEDEDDSLSMLEYEPSAPSEMTSAQDDTMSDGRVTPRFLRDRSANTVRLDEVAESVFVGIPVSRYTARERDAAIEAKVLNVSNIVDGFVAPA